jgi:hypothetical protein
MNNSLRVRRMPSGVYSLNLPRAFEATTLLLRSAQIARDVQPVNSGLSAMGVRGHSA